MGVILTASPATKTAGTFGAALTVLNTGIWHFQFTTTAASSTYVGGNFHGLIVQDHGGIWLVDATLTLFNFADGTAFTRALTWSAGQTIDGTVDTRSGTRSVTISGATTGNGTQTFTDPGPYFDGGVNLYLGNYASPFQFVGTLSDVDDTAAAVVERSVALTVAAGASTALTRSISRAASVSVAAAAAVAATGIYSRSAAISVAAGASTAATVSTPGATERSATLLVAAGASTALTRSLQRTATTGAAADAASAATRTLQRSSSISAAAGASTAATVAGAVSFGPGVQTSGIWTFGHSAAACTIPGGYLPGGTGPDADGRTPPASLTTQAADSTFYIALARPVATSNKTITDSKGNTYTSLAIGDYGGASAWESQILVSVNGTGGSAHTWTANSILNDETTFAVDEIKQCHYLAGYVTAFTIVGSAQISPTGLNLKGPGWVYVDWFGEGPVSGAEGFDWTITAIDEGSTVGAQWQVVDSRVRNHTDGWIQWKRWRRYYAAATTNIRLQLATVSPNQGARWYAAAFMEANITEATAALTVVADASTAVLARRERSASMTAAAAASTAATGAYARSVALSVAAGAQVAGVAVRARSAAIGVAAGAAAAAMRSVPRSASISAAADAGTAASRTLERSVALSVAAGASTELTVSSSGAVERSAEILVAADVATAATRSIQRSAALGATASAVTAATRTLSRSATILVVAGASSSATVAGAAPDAPRPLPATIAISVVGAAPFRMVIE